MMCRRRWIGLAAGLGALLGGARTFAQGSLPQRKPWPKGQATPALVLPDDAGHSWSLTQARGRVVVLNFWATWCEPCRAELPSLELLAARHEARGLQVLTVNYRETDAALRRFTERQPLSLPILRDVDGGATRAFEVRTFPTTLVFDRRGQALYSVVGEADWTAEPARGWIDTLMRD